MKSKCEKEGEKVFCLEKSILTLACHTFASPLYPTHSHARSLCLLYLTSCSSTGRTCRMCGRNAAGTRVLWCSVREREIVYIERVRACLPVWPDWAIYWTLGNFSKPGATISLHKSPTFWGYFCKGVKILILLVKSFLGNFYRHLATFYRSHCSCGTSHKHTCVRASR